MAGGAQKLTSLTTALFVLLAHLACACTPAGAASREPAAEAKPVGHECCRHSNAGQPRVPADHVPAEDHKHNCPHCAGGIAAASQPAERGLAAAAVSHDPFAATAGSRDSLPTPSDVSPNACRFDSSPPLSPATLLGLRCALNL